MDTWPAVLTEGLAMLGMLGPYAWYILGALLCLLELHAPGASFIWLAVASFLVGAYVDVDRMLGYAPPPWQAQVVAFAALAILAVVLWSKFGRRVERRSDRPFLNRRLEALIGEIFVVREPIVNGTGAIKVGDTTWRVQGPDVPAGGRVVVRGANGPTLIVEPAPEATSPHAAEESASR